MVTAPGAGVEGSSAADSSLVTGESMPVEVVPGRPGDRAKVNMSGRLVVTAVTGDCPQTAR